MYESPGIKKPKNTGEVGARSRAEVEALLTIYETGDFYLPEHLEGVLSLLRWILGRTPYPPGSDNITVTSPPTVAELDAESELLDRLVTRPVGTGKSRTYWDGAEHMLMWVRGQVEDRPLLDPAS